jgi:hypothetical protein
VAATGATTTTTAARQLLCGCPRFRGEWEHIPVFVWRARCAAWPVVTPPSTQKQNTSKCEYELSRRNACSVPCRANRFGPMGMISELPGAVCLPIPPRGAPLVDMREPSSSTTDQPRTKSQECDVPRPGCFNGVGCKRGGPRTSWIEGQTELPAPAPRAKEVARNST